MNSPLYDLMPEKKATTVKPLIKWITTTLKMEHDIHSEAVKQAG